jgi:carbamoylphosphate synthase small subunit
VEVHGAIRVQPAAAMMGQAAGTAAVQAIRTGQPACDLDTRALVETLRNQGAYLPQPHLRREMTRC